MHRTLSAVLAPNSPRRLIQTSIAAAIGFGLFAGAPVAAAGSAQAGANWSMLSAQALVDGRMDFRGIALPGLGMLEDEAQPFAANFVTRSVSPLKRVARVRAEAGGLGPNARADWFYFQRAYPLAFIPEGARQKALAQAEKIAEVQGRAKASGAQRLDHPTGRGPDRFNFFQPFRVAFTESRRAPFRTAHAFFLN